MKKNLWWILMALLMTGCLDDDNDFNYSKINDVLDSKVTNIEESYVCYPGESVTLRPKVKLTVDSINPDISYEWHVKNEVVSRDSVYTFTATEVGDILVVFCAVDNKTGVKYPFKIDITVQSRWLNGWAVLSRKTDGSSQLSMVLMKEERLTLPDNSRKDTIVYTGQDIDVYPGLGKGPRKLFENFSYCDSQIGDLVWEGDELVVLQDDKCIELNGGTLTREVYTEEEFPVLPDNFNPIDVVFSYSCKCILNEDGYLYLNFPAVATDFHSGRYLKDPAFNGEKFSAIIPVNRQNPYKGKFFFAVSAETNSLIGIVDESTPYGSRPDFDPRNQTGARLTFANDANFDMGWFNNIDKEILYASWNNTYYDNGGCVCVLTDGSNYFLHSFAAALVQDDPIRFLEIKKSIHKQVNAEMFSGGFTDAAIFPHKEYIVIASGNSLSLSDYGDKNEFGKKFLDFDHKITSIAGKDHSSSELGGGHIGVGLENGDFYIYEVIVDEDSGDVTARELYHYSGLGTVVDVLYKHGWAYSM